MTENARLWDVNWTEALTSLGLRKQFITLSTHDTHVLKEEYAREMGVDMGRRLSIEPLALRIDAEVFDLGGQVYAKIGLKGYQPPVPATDGADIVRRLSADGWCISQLDAAKHEPCDATIVLRKWESWEPWQEFRLWIQAGRLVGISQYDLFRSHETLVRHRELLRDLIVCWSKERLIPHLPVPTLTADIVVPNGAGEIKLLDLNSIELGSDAKLFDVSGVVPADCEIRILRPEDIIRTSEVTHAS